MDLPPPTTISRAFDRLGRVKYQDWCRGWVGDYEWTVEVERIGLSAGGFRCVTRWVSFETMSRTYTTERVRREQRDWSSGHGLLPLLQSTMFLSSVT